MIILGIDPGTATTGYGILNVKTPKSIKTIDYGQIKTSKDCLMPDRLVKIYNSSKGLMKKHSPDIVVIERLFFNTNVKTAISVGQARGVYILAAGKCKIPVFEYTALEAKMELTGYGRSDKNTVRESVKKILKIKTDIKPIDASDALAIALCYIIKTMSTKNGASKKG